jgi:ribosomal protein S18 acetylase RimI-like enzyme
MIKIRNILAYEINKLQNFPPEDWRMDLPKFISFHLGSSYFYPIVAEIENEIVGFGNGILNGKTGWIGNIIVLPEYRGQGIGHLLTTHLVEYFTSKGCTSQLLIASEMGKNIYSRIGFRTVSTYEVYQKNEELFELKQSTAIRPIKQKDIPAVKKLDLRATAEKRSRFIERFFKTAYVYESEEEISGFYLPNLGGGFIAAENPEAGLELIKFRLRKTPTNAVVPSENEIAINFLENEGFQKIRNMPKMVLGKNLPWNPELIYNRGAGYCG